MGTMFYSMSDIETSFDDRILAHIQVVVLRKLRRKEMFFFT